MRNKSLFPFLFPTFSLSKKILYYSYLLFIYSKPINFNIQLVLEVHMDDYEEFVKENINLENGVDPSTFEEFLEPEEYVDHRHLFTTDRIFNSKPGLVNWAKETAIKVNTYLIVTRYLRSRTSDRRPYVTLGCERGGANKPKKKTVVDDEEKEVQVKRRGPYRTKKCGCPFKLKGEQMAISREDNNMLSDIVVVHPTSIEMLRTWPYVLIMDTTYKTNKLRRIDGFFNRLNIYTFQIQCQQRIKKMFVGLCRRRHINQNVLAKLTELIKNEEVASRFINGSWKKLLDEIDEQEYLIKLDALKTKWSRPDFLHYLFNNWLNPFAHKFVRCWTKSHMHFGVETTNRAESEHSVLKLCFSTCHGDLDTVFFNIDSLIEGQIANIKVSLEFSKTKEKHNAKSNHIFYILHDIDVFWRTLEIGGPHPSAQLQDMDSEMRSLTDLLHQISMGPISKVREMRRLAKRVLDPVSLEDPGVTLTSPPEVAVTKGRKKTESTKRHKSHWEHVSLLIERYRS
ncbi:hypothetical protein M9H77_07482 [Catharanthus roseus]|uniref:Uncharacterized protein n=1 Tax=Catharanthus roseus TaxID=4058 RepID=A0ACC0BVA8_CATRO|nr:hypothetical protein M9H77_07482 [Catharanthus roseus]